MELWYRLEEKFGAATVNKDVIQQEKLSFMKAIE